MANRVVIDRQAAHCPSAGSPCEHGSYNTIELITLAIYPAPGPASAPATPQANWQSPAGTTSEALRKERI